MKFHTTKILKEIITFNLYLILKNHAKRGSTEFLKIIKNQEKPRKAKKNQEKTKKTKKNLINTKIKKKTRKLRKSMKNKEKTEKN